MEGVFLSLGQFPVVTGFQRVGLKTFGQKPDWNRNSESKAHFPASVGHPFRFPRELLAFHMLGLQ